MTGENADVRNRGDEAVPEEAPFYIVAPSPTADDQARVLKQGDAFAVFDHYGDVKPVGLGEEGLYFHGTRFLSCLLLSLGPDRPLFLSSTVKEDNDVLAVDLTNPDVSRDGRIEVPRGRLHIARTKFLWRRRLLRTPAPQELSRRTHRPHPRADLRRRLFGYFRGPWDETRRPRPAAQARPRRRRRDAGLRGAGRRDAPHPAGLLAAAHAADRQDRALRRVAAAGRRDRHRPHRRLRRGRRGGRRPALRPGRKPRRPAARRRDAPSSSAAATNASTTG